MVPFDVATYHQSQAEKKGGMRYHVLGEWSLEDKSGFPLWAKNGPEEDNHPTTQATAM